MFPFHGVCIGFLIVYSAFPELRSKEKRLLAGLLLMQAVNMSMATLLSSIAPIATFAAHIAFGNNLTVSEVSAPCESYISSFAF